MVLVEENQELVVNYAPQLPFTISNMWLTIEPNFQKEQLKGIEQLRIVTNRSLDKIELDCSKQIDIESVFFSWAADSDNINNPIKLETTHNRENDKLEINLGQSLPDKSKFHLIINYLAKGSEPGTGFYFVPITGVGDGDEEEGDEGYQTWTQGEAIESRNWFPTYDHPQIKFPRELAIIVPDGYTVISNGELDIINISVAQINGQNKKKFVWVEQNPNPAYLTAVVIGKFAETSKGFIYKNRIPLRYYVPKDREPDADRTFKDTPKMMEFFEQYFGTLFPYDKYSQVVVKNFPYGGMENTTCTILEEGLLHDERAHLDFTSDDVISHELAHHWFGDLVTCKDWEHLWLNEGFASYSEALYWEESRGKNEFYYYLLEMFDYYLNSVRINGKKKIATKIYSHPDQLFDTAHMYKKGGLVVHMIRNLIGENDFKNGLKIYLEKFKHKSTEIDDIRKAFEESSGETLELFFDQWLYKEGHPELEIEYSTKSDNTTIILKVVQKQKETLFNLPLDVKFAYSTESGEIKSTTLLLNLTGVENSIEFKLPPKTQIEWFSIDPDFKIIKVISKYINVPLKFFQTKVQNLEDTTIIERIDAIRYLRAQKVSDENVIELLKKIVMEEPSLENTFWGVSKEAAITLSSIKDDERMHEILKQCFHSVKDTKIKKILLESIRKFKKIEDIDFFKDVVNNPNGSYYVQQEAAIGIGQVAKPDDAFSILRRLSNYPSFQDLIAQGAIFGLGRTITRSDNISNTSLISKIIDVLIEKTSVANSMQQRNAATISLGYAIKDNNNMIRTNIYDLLKGLSSDKSSVIVRNSAVTALSRGFYDSQNDEVVQVLDKVVKEDSDGQVRKTAREAIGLVKKEKEITEKIAAGVTPDEFVKEKLNLMQNRIVQK